jgi:CRISPR system Cascade subunit CasD
VTLHLVFTLYAPFGSWGAASLSAANQAYKATELSPPRSALVGLIGAALGRARWELPELAEKLYFAVREGVPPVRDLAADYHTTTRGDPPAGRARWTRLEELRRHLMGTDTAGSIISRREYWTNGLWTVAVAGRTGEGDLDTIREALERPRWALYAGRKSCSLGLPPDPEVIDAGKPVQAHRRYGWPWERHPGVADQFRRLRGAIEHATALRLLYDPDYPGAPAPQRVRVRRDDPAPSGDRTGRIVRLYLERREAEVLIPSPSHALSGDPA